MKRVLQSVPNVSHIGMGMSYFFMSILVLKARGQICPLLVSYGRSTDAEYCGL